MAFIRSYGVGPDYLQGSVPESSPENPPGMQGMEINSATV